jgi:membrane-associated phospholipid phosphatase
MNALGRRFVLPLLLAAALGRPVVSAAQDSLPTRSRAPLQLGWRHGAIILGVVGIAMAFDEPYRRYDQSHGSTDADNVAKVFRRMGQPEVFATVGLGVLGAGLVSGDDGLTRAGARITTSLLVAGGTVTVLKAAIGRRRPLDTKNAFSFRPFSGNDALPSGHTSMAFALATSVSDELHSPVASVLLYTAATGTAWSRTNDNKHWLSDVVAGAAVGITSAKLVNGRWRIFGLRPPAFLLAPGQAGLRWDGRF